MRVREENSGVEGEVVIRTSECRGKKRGISRSVREKEKTYCCAR